MEYLRLAEINMEEHIGKRVFATFMCKSVEVKTQKDGVTEYLVLCIQDRNVEESGVKIFSPTAYQMENIKAGNTYKAAIDVQRFEHSKKGYTCMIYNISLISEDTTEYLDWDNRVTQAASKVVDTINEIRDTTYSAIVYDILNSRWNKFTTYPAATSMHHNKLGGLCVHTIEVVNIAKRLANTIEDIYGEKLNIDLIVSAAMLHDVGKTEELDVDMKCGKSEYSALKSLQSHVIYSTEYVETTCMKLKLGAYSNDSSNTDECEKITLLKHCILAHHGKIEYGSPVEPSTFEAYIVSKADGISAEAYKMHKNLSQMDSGSSKVNWAHGKMERYYKSREIL